MAKKLTNEDLQQFESMLRRALDHITGDIKNLEQEALGGDNGPPETLGDDGGGAYAQEFSLELLEKDEKTVNEIIGALDRIAEGTFGRCGVCEKWVRKTRLKAVPHARNCIDCQRESENGTF
jgi:RNA polymerase-binding transcription factor DksA